MSTPRVIRKKTGNFLEDFAPGQILRHKGGKTITEGLVSTFGDFSMSTNPLTKNARVARAHGFEGLVCSPGLVMLVCFSQTVEDVSENARANLEELLPRLEQEGVFLEGGLAGFEESGRDDEEPPEGNGTP